MANLTHKFTNNYYIHTEKWDDKNLLDCPVDFDYLELHSILHDAYSNRNQISPVEKLGYGNYLVMNIFYLKMFQSRANNWTEALY